MEKADRASLCRNMTFEQYNDVIEVLKMMPHIAAECNVEGYFQVLSDIDLFRLLIIDWRMVLC